MLDVLIVKDSLQKQILPYLVKLKFTALRFIVDSFVQVDPELLKILEAVLQVLVAAHDKVEHLLVLLLAIQELLKAYAGGSDVVPRASLALSPDKLVAAVLGIHVNFLLLLVSN